MMRALCAGVLLANVAAPVAPLAARQAKPAKPVKVFAFVEKSASGFVDQKTRDLSDTLNDLQLAIQKKKDWLQLVERRDQAVIVVQVLDRVLKASGRFETTGGVAIATSREVQLYTVRSVMSFGAYKNELVGSIQDTYLLGGLWRTAASDVANQLERWVKDNYTKLQVDNAIK